MAKILAIHSYRRGTGKSSLAVNLAVLFAAAGKRAGLIDFSQPPCLHLPFGLQSSEIGYYLDDYLDEECAIEQVAQDVTGRLEPDLSGKVFLIPASPKFDEADLAPRKYPAERMEKGILDATEMLALDHLVLDTPAGINDNALLALAICDTLLEILRLDQQDYQGTAVVLELAQKLAIPEIHLVVNFVTERHQPKAIKAKLQRSYGFDVAAILPNSEDMLVNSVKNTFVLARPQHPLTLALQKLAEKLGAKSP
jgi:MinD-like ATPase involved in chromosome partitioning or flagellar assembly